MNKNRKNLKAVLSIVLCIVLLIGAVPLTAFATNAETGTVEESFIDEATGKEITEAVKSSTNIVRNPDEIKGYVFEDYYENTEYVYSKEDLTYLFGYPDKTVQGERNLSRAEACAIFYRLYDGEYPKFNDNRMTSKTFSDIKPNAWYYTEIETLYNIGIIVGYDNGTFMPDSPVTRAEFATMAYKWSELEYEDKQAFSDVTLDDCWAYGFINAAAKAGWISGYGDGTFKPQRNITRAETVTLVNRMINRIITKEELQELEVTNPYTDLTDLYWAYADLIEATVKHHASEWHKTKYRDGKFNIVIEHFVDEDGNIIADDVVTDGKELKAKDINKYSYLGYITDITYVYNKGTADMKVSKSANKDTANVGDTITYSIEVSNSDNAKSTLENVTVNDTLSEHLSFVQGSVQLDGYTQKYSYNGSTKLLSVSLGDIAPNSSKTVTFDVIVNPTAYGVTIRNTAVAEADNHLDVSDTDGGVVIDKGTADMSVSKSVSIPKASVGDNLTYIIKVYNDKHADVNLENVIVSDTLSEYLTFAHGSVQVDGYTYGYSFDASSKTLKVEIGDIAPNQTKTITFEAVVNSTAYGAEFYNTAVAIADNDSEKSGTDGGVVIENGTPEGSVGAKTVSSSTAKVGDTLTYSITLRNASTATADWKNIVVTDTIPEYLSFVSGSVELNGIGTTNHSYDADSRTLKLYADKIGVGEEIKFTFKAEVEDGAQGLYIVNTAVVTSEGRNDIELPDTGVQIDAGQTKPVVNKSASVSEAKEGDIFSYTITLRNETDATAAWKNVTMTDIIPTGLKLVGGTVTLNNETVSYGISGQAISVYVGDLVAGQQATIKLDVRVLAEVVGTTVTNVAIAKGDNGDKTGTDNGVEIIKPENDKGLTGEKTVDKTVVSSGNKVTFTVKAKNNTDEVWKNAYVYDVLDTSMVTLITDTIYVDGVRFLADSGKWTYSDKQLVIYTGDINPNGEVKVSFSVLFKNDAVGSTYVNNAVIKGTDGKMVYLKSPEISIIGGDGNTWDSEIHYKIFSGIADYDGTPLYVWEPNEPMDIAHMCIAGYKIMTDNNKIHLGNGTITVPSEIKTPEVRFMISHGVISASEYKGETPATLSQVNRILNFSIGSKLPTTGSSAVARIDVASQICSLTNRDTSPNTNGLPVAYFTDKGPYAGLIDEVSNTHDYTVDSYGNETWESTTGVN